MTDHKSSGHGAVSTYIVGFVLAVILTVIPFWMAMKGSANFTILVIFAAVQVVVHVVCFLHIDLSPAQRWNLKTFIFAIITILIIVIGSVWVMENSMQNMMSDNQLENMHMMHKEMQNGMQHEGMQHSEMK